MKILHAADFHLDSPIQGRTPEQTNLLRSALLQVPHKVAAAAMAENCDIMLLCGDLFDGPYTQESYRALYTSLEEVGIPVFITPGNHDPLTPDSPWTAERWPENVHIFGDAAMESVYLPALNCYVYGAALTAPEAPGLLEGFHANNPDGYAIGMIHGDPTQATSPYCPVTAAQIENSQLDYLALGHIHKRGELRAGRTLCAWPGCPMGRGFDELGEKGVLIVTLDNGCDIRFLPLAVPRFFREEVDVKEDAEAALAAKLPALGNAHFYRMILTGESAPVDTDSLLAQFPHFPNLELRDRTVPPIDLWATAGDDTLEGVYFRLLLEAMEGQDEATCRQIRLAAKISRRILDGQEVQLP